VTHVGDESSSDAAPRPPAPAVESRLSRLQWWVALVGGLGSAAAVVWAVVAFFIPIGTVDVTVRIDQEVQVGLPSGSARDALRLVHDGREITHASVMTIEVVNSGAQRIGSLDKPWELRIRSVDGSPLVPLGSPSVTPAGRPVSIRRGATPDVAVITLSLFNRRDTVKQDLMLIEPKTSTGLPIVAETNVEDLSQPYTGRQDVRGRLRDAFTLPILFVSFAVIAGMVYRERRYLQREGIALGEIHKLPFGLIPIFMAAVISGGAIVWTLAWLAERVLAR
jgi:hypothetical protein